MMNAVDRLALAAEVFDCYFAATESFEEDDNIGAGLAYLLGAIVKNDKYSLSTDAETEPFGAILIEHFPRTHPVWTFVTRESDADYEDLRRHNALDLN